MAQAKRAIKKATGEDKGVLLVLTNTEAEVLRVVLGYVGGDDKTSPRKYSQRIFDALGNVGVAWDMEHYATVGRNSIYFEDYPAKVKEPKKVPEVVQQVAPKFQVGDRVKVGKFDHPEIYWVRDMDSTVGSEGTITEVYIEFTPEGYRVNLDSGNYWTYPAAGLELVTEAPAAAPEVTPPTITMGSRVQLKEAAGSFRAGETAKVTRLGCGGSVTIESIGCGPTRTAGVYREDLIAA